MLRINARPIFLEYATNKLHKLNDSLADLRLQYKEAEEEARPFIQSKAETIKKDIEYLEYHLQVNQF